MLKRRVGCATQGAQRRSDAALCASAGSSECKDMDQSERGSSWKEHKPLKPMLSSRECSESLSSSAFCSRNKFISGGKKKNARKSSVARKRWRDDMTACLSETD